MKIRLTSIYSQKQVKCGEEIIGTSNRISYHLLQMKTVEEIGILLSKSANSRWVHSSRTKPL